MSFIGDFIYAAAYVYVLLIIIRVLLTWINPNPYSPVMRYLSMAVDPVLRGGRRLFPFTLGGIDFSPVLVIIALSLAGFFIGRGLVLLGHGAPPAVLLPLLALALISFMDQIAWIIFILMSLRVLMSLVNPAPYNPVVMIVYGLTEPLLAPLRGFFLRGPGGLDFRALIFLAATLLVQHVLLGRLYLLTAAWIGRLAPGF
ncbi:MAG: YggT family protein [Candidatus Adiutrix sp.]|jgi:YggT family protein|nr:YggT family protein [Candidatus Adiutrix sp.]